MRQPADKKLQSLTLNILKKKLKKISAKDAEISHGRLVYFFFVVSV